MTTAVMTRVFDPPVSTSNLVQPAARDLCSPMLAWPMTAGLWSSCWRAARFVPPRRTLHTLCNGFWALVLAIRALALPGTTDILMPSLTYRRMADVAAWARLRPRFCEVDPVSLACTGADHARRAPPGSRPVARGASDREPMRRAGLDRAREELGLPLLFDSVESVFEQAQAGKIGGSARAECFSLHASKLLNGFEGGYITTNDPALAHPPSPTMRDGVGEDAMDCRLNRFHAAMALAALDELDDQVARNKAPLRDLPAPAAERCQGVRLLAFDEDRPTSYKTIVVELTDALAARPCRRHSLA